jgi:hypothetical protein
VQSIIVTALAPTFGYGVEPLARRYDRLRSCACGGHRGAERATAKAGLVAAKVVNEMAATLDAAAPHWPRVTKKPPARCSTRPAQQRTTWAAFDEAAKEGLAIVRHSPFRRPPLAGG